MAKSSVDSKPELRISHSENTIDVSIIDTKARIRVLTVMFMADQIPGHEFLEAPSYHF